MCTKGNYEGTHTNTTGERERKREKRKKKRKKQENVYLTKGVRKREVRKERQRTQSPDRNRKEGCEKKKECDRGVYTLVQVSMLAMVTFFLKNPVLWVSSSLKFSRGVTAAVSGVATVTVGCLRWIGGAIGMELGLDDCMGVCVCVCGCGWGGGGGGGGGW